MAMRPHWLDEVFKDPAKAKESLLSHSRIAKAIDAAQAAFHKQQEYTKHNPGITGGVPEQSARTAFLESLELQTAE